MLKIWGQNGPNSDPPGILATRQMGFLFQSFLLWGPWEPPLSTESLKASLGAPKCLPKLSKILEKLPHNRRTNRIQRWIQY